MRPSKCGFILVVSCTLAAALLECQRASVQSTWPTYHVVNNVTNVIVCKNGHCAWRLVMEPLNDANAIFEYKGLYHAMNQAGGGNWTYTISNDLVSWYRVRDALGRGPPKKTRRGTGTALATALPPFPPARALAPSSCTAPTAPTNYRHMLPTQMISTE